MRYKYHKKTCRACWEVEDAIWDMFTEMKRLGLNKSSYPIFKQWNKILKKTRSIRNILDNDCAENTEHPFKPPYYGLQARPRTEKFNKQWLEAKKVWKGEF